MAAVNIKSILHSFATVFPYSYVFSAYDLSSDLILFASEEPLPLHVAALRRPFAQERLGAELRRAGVASVEDLLANLLLPPDEIAAFTSGTPLNTDDNALIEFAAPRD